MAPWVGLATQNLLSRKSSHRNDWGLITDYKEEIIDFSKNPTKGPTQVGFDYSYILPASLDIPPMYI